MQSTVEQLLNPRLSDLLREGPSRFRLKFLYIDGVEVTQAIQYYKAAEHLTDAADRGADNSVQSVMYKPAWVRVYVSSVLFSPVTVRGHLKLQRSTGWLPIFTEVATIAPQWPGTAATHQTNYAVERGTLGATLNFVIPAAEMFGNLKITAEIWADGGSAAAAADTYEVSIGVNLEQTLALRGVMISYNGPNAAGTTNLNLAAPSVADLATTAAWSLTTMPVHSQGVFSSAGTLAWSTPLTGTALSPGGCSQQWINLNAAVAQVRTTDGNRTNVIYYGLLPNGIPIANVGGCESSGVSSGANGAGVTMAHEIGHACGLAHAPCGTPGDVNYPAYEPYDPAHTPTASLGEYGLDINSGQIHGPAEKDLMSYCGGSWFSLYHYQRLIQNDRLNPQWRRLHFELPELVDPYLWPWEYIPDPPPNWLADWRRVVTQPLISVIAIVGLDEQITVQSVMRVDAVGRLDGAHATPYALQLLGREGAIVAETPLLRLPSHGCDGCKESGNDHAPFLAQALLPDVEPGTQLRIVIRDVATRTPREVWSRRAPEAPPQISGIEVDLDESGGHARWRAQGSGEPLEFALQFSKDHERSWNSVAVGLREPEVDFKTEALPAGDLIFRVLAHDGFHTARATSRPIRLRERPPIVAILFPSLGDTLRAAAPMRLWASVDLRDGRRIDEKSCRWMLDDAEAGVGTDLFVTAPPAGKHSCLLTVESRSGIVHARVEFETVEDNRPPTRRG